MSLRRPTEKPAAGTPRKGTRDKAGASADLAQRLEAQQLYIARLEATLAAGGLTEKCARLEGKLQRAQQRAQAQEVQLAEHQRVREEQAHELEALRSALHSKVEEWGVGSEGSTAETAGLVVGLFRAQEDAKRLQRQLQDQAAEMERLRALLEDLGAANRALQTSINQHVAESRRTQEHVQWLSAEIQAMEETKLQMLAHMEQAVEDLRVARQRLQDEQECRAAAEAKAKEEAAAAQTKVAEAQAEVVAVQAQHRQLLLLRALHTQRAGAEADRAEQLEHLARELQERVDQLMAARADQEQRATNAEQRLSDVVLQRDAAAQQLSELQRANATLQAQADAAASLTHSLEAAKAHAAQLEAGQQRLAHQLALIADHCAHFLLSCRAEAVPREDAYALVCRVVARAAQVTVDLDALRAEAQHDTAEQDAVIQALQAERDELRHQVLARQQEAQRLQLLNAASRRRCLAAMREPGLGELLGDGHCDTPALLDCRPQPNDQALQLRPLSPALSRLSPAPLQSLSPRLAYGRPTPTLTDLARPDLDLP